MSEPLEKTPDDLTGSEPKAKQQGWFLAVLPVAMIAACAELGTAILNNSALPVFYTKGLNISLAIYPWLMIPFFVSEALFKSPLGVLADRFGRKPLMLCGALVTVFTALLLTCIRYNPEAPNAVAVLFALGFLRLIDGAGGAALWPALYAYVGDVVEENRRGAAMGLLNMVYTAQLGICFLAGGFVDDYFGPYFEGEASFSHQMQQAVGHVRQAGQHMRDRLQHHAHSAPPVSDTPVDTVVSHLMRPEHYYPSFYLASILFAIAACVAALALRSKVRPTSSFGPGEASHTDEHHVTKADFKATMRSVPEFLAIAFVTFLGIGCIASLVKIFILDEFHLTEQQVGVIALVPMLVIALLAIPVGHLADRWGKTRAVRLGFSLCAIGLWGIPLLHHFQDAKAIGFLAAATVLGLGSTIAFPAWMALLTMLSSASSRGMVIGTVSTAQGVGMLLGVLIGPPLYKHVGHIAPFVAAAALVSVGALLSLLFVRENRLRSPATVTT